MAGDVEAPQPTDAQQRHEAQMLGYVLGLFFFYVLHDALQDLLPMEEVQKLMDRGIVEIAPLAYMRGRTLNNAFIILDEAQNATAEQMLMFLTRLGFNSKAVITGDPTQIDLPSSKRSGLIEAKRALARVDGIALCEFERRDVVRHPLVQRIVEAYEALRKSND